MRDLKPETRLSRNPASSTVEESLRKLLEPARSQVRRWLVRGGIEPGEREDLTQEILIKVWEARHRWDPQRGFWPWLRNITVNHCRDWRQRRSRDPLLQAHSWEELPLQEHLPAEGPSPEEQFLQEEQRQKVWAAIAELPARYREVLWLFYLQGWTCGKIAEALGLSVSQVEGRLFRGRSHLRKSLPPSWPE